MSRSRPLFERETGLYGIETVTAARNIIPIKKKGFIVTLREFLQSIPRGWEPYYKDCYVDGVDVISENYACISLAMPLPVGGIIREVVSLDTFIEKRIDAKGKYLYE